MSSVEEIREIVKNLAVTFYYPKGWVYIDFYDESLRTCGFSQHHQVDKGRFKQFIYLLWNAFPDITKIFEDVLIEGNLFAGRYRLEETHKGKSLDL